MRLHEPEVIDVLVELLEPGKGALIQVERHVVAQILATECPYGKPGDRLWVRETFICGWPSEDDILYDYDNDGNELPQHIWYRADGINGSWSSDRGEPISQWADHDGGYKEIPWKPSIHMPRAASRITLEIEDVRVERVQDIADKDSWAEGAICTCENEDRCEADGRFHFRKLWDSANAKRGHGWDSNLWVWVLTFRRVGNEQ